jgi:hypothetical protein
MDASMLTRSVNTGFSGGEEAKRDPPGAVSSPGWASSAGRLGSHIDGAAHHGAYGVNNLKRDNATSRRHALSGGCLNCIKSPISCTCS